MEDHEIVALYWQRDESAIQCTAGKYEPYLLKIAYNILANREDSEEAVNDTYLKAWNAMPPHRPQVLSTFLGKITRQLSIDLFRRRNRGKRRNSQYELSLSELRECAGGGDVEQEMDLRLLAEAIGAYLRTLSPEVRSVFLCRYYFMDSIREVAAYHGMGESRVKSMLYRARLGLKSYLEQEGFTL